MSPEFVSWEIEYFDGRIVRERDGVAYGKLVRHGVKSFYLYSSEIEERLIEIMVNGRTNFFYRRRTQMAVGAERRVVYLVGLYPDYCVIVDPALGHVSEGPVDINPMEFEKRSSEGQVALR